jgi:hypothetical protein
MCSTEEHDKARAILGFDLYETYFQSPLSIGFPEGPGGAIFYAGYVFFNAHPVGPKRPLCYVRTTAPTPTHPPHTRCHVDRDTCALSWVSWASATALPTRERLKCTQLPQLRALRLHPRPTRSAAPSPNIARHRRLPDSDHRSQWPPRPHKRRGRGPRVRETLHRSPCDHHPVVCAQLRWWYQQVPLRACTQRAEASAESAVCRHAAADD